MEITVDAGNRPTDLVLHLPVASVQKIRTVRVDGKTMTPLLQLAIPHLTGQTKIEVELAR